MLVANVYQLSGLNQNKSNHLITNEFIPTILYFKSVSADRMLDMRIA